MGKKADITVEEAARIMRKDPQFVRYGLRQNRFNFGCAVQMPSGHWSYCIIKDKFLEFVGVKESNTNEKDNV